MLRGIGRPKGQRRLWVLTLLLALVAALVLAACGGSGGTTTTSSTATEAEPAESEPAETEETTEEGGIAAAPQFTSEELFEPAGDNWVTNGGGTTNDRFSSLCEINTENVKELKGEWMTKIGQNATAAKFSAEGQALEYEGTIYIADGADESSRSTPATAIASGPTNRTFRPTRSAKSSAAVGTTAASRSATAWCSSPS